MEPAKLKEIAEGLLETAKANLIRDGELLPLLVRIVDDEITLIGIASLEEKRRTYSALSALLRKAGATAAIMVNDAYMKTFPRKHGTEAFQVFNDTYKQGDLSVDMEASECITIAIKGPGIAPMASSLPYVRGPNGDITFQEGTGWSDTAECNMMPDWWG